MNGSMRYSSAMSLALLMAYFLVLTYDTQHTCPCEAIALSWKVKCSKPEKKYHKAYVKSLGFFVNTNPVTGK